MVLLLKINKNISGGYAPTTCYLFYILCYLYSLYFYHVILVIVLFLVSIVSNPHSYCWCVLPEFHLLFIIVLVNPTLLFICSCDQYRSNRHLIYRYILYLSLSR